MSAKKTDIQQMGKYLKGELDARAMHLLEKQAQDDPFLMAAMEGFEQAGTDPQPAMFDLNKRLEQRISQSKKSGISWKVIAAAASVIMVLTIGGLWLFNEQPAQKQITAAVIHSPDKPLEKKAPVDSIILQEKPAVNSIAAAVQQNLKKTGVPQIAPAAAAPITATAVTDKKTSNNSMGYQGFVSTPAPVDSDRSKSALKEVKIRGVQPIKERSLLSKVDGVTIINPKPPTAEEELAITGKVSGKVVSNVDMQPIPGATVQVDGKGNYTQTDAQGRFVIDASKKDVINVRSLGYQAQHIKVKDSLNVVMQDDNRSLSEVVVVGYGTAKSKKVIEEAHPVTGWDNYKKYLADKAIAIDHKTGSVKVSFLVNGDGSLSDFNITKKLNEAAEQKAISLIKNGPRWIANVDGKPEIVEVKVKFR